MKTKQLGAAILLITGIFTVNAQTNTATATISSGGLQAGTTGTGNAFYGYQSGKPAAGEVSGSNNTFVGHMTGVSTGSDSSSNTFIGFKAGTGNYDGKENVSIGAMAGSGLSDGSRNVLIGASSALNNNGANNVIIGHKAGFLNNNSYNVFVGYNAGYNETGSNKLYIENSNSTTPLIWGDFSTDLLKFNGKTGIGLGTAAFPNTAGGVAVNTYQLFVKGGILTEELRIVAMANWADYVFEDDYKLAPLTEVECFIEENGHLPNVPSAKQIKEEGIEVGQMAKIQQEKIEELTLYIIEQDKQLKKQQLELQELRTNQQQEINELKTLVQALANKN